MTELTLHRYDANDKRTFGHLKLGDELIAHTLELPWRENERKKSCIPTGTYEVVPYSSAKWPRTFHVLDVPNRDGILIHWGSFLRNTEGCILAGDRRAISLKEEIVSGTKYKIEEMYNRFYNGFTLVIT